MQDHSQMNPDANPVNPLPPVVVLLFLLILGVECAFYLAGKGIIGGPQGIGWRVSAVKAYAFSDTIFDWMLANNRWLPEHLMRFVTYPFVHSAFTHMLFVGVMLLAMGKMVGEAMGNLAVLAIFSVSAIGGALVYALVLDTGAPLVGGFPSVYGLIGGFTFLLWRNLSLVGARQLQAFRLIGFLMGIQLVFGLLFGSDNSWVADLAGFAFGFALSFLVVPGGWARFRRGIRHN